jgi:hypothetical protein
MFQKVTLVLLTPVCFMLAWIGGRCYQADQYWLMVLAAAVLGALTWYWFYIERQIKK